MKKRFKKKPAMPQRPRQHELDTEALEYIRGKLPASWTRQEIVQDYGKDLLVEIFESGEATGLEFRIQSKGHEHFTIRHKNQVIQQLEVSKLNYYEKLPLPILLIAYSAQEKQACCLWVKPYIRKLLDQERPGWRELGGDSEISIRIPLSNIFDESTSEDILHHVETEISKIWFLIGSKFQYIESQKSIYRNFFTSTRLIRPKITNYLHRSRLTGVLIDALAQRSVFIQSDAGYGKTWLIQDFINTNNPPFAVWYTFTKDPLDASRFVEELIFEFARQTNQIGSETLRLIKDRGKEVRFDEAIAVLLDEVTSALNKPILLILEDLHNTNDNAIHLAIDTLLISRPKNLQIILTSRLPLPIGQAKLIAQGQLTILERSDLVFNSDETREYLKSVVDIDLSPEQMQLLLERTGGWIAAVSLAIEVLQDRSAQSNELFNRLTGFEGNIYNFFAEEVYGTQSNEIRWLLKRLSVVRSIQSDIVNIFTGRIDGGQVLKDLARRNTFLIMDDAKGEPYRLHTLFAEFLITRFRDEEGLEALRKVHCVLAKYYLSHREWYLGVEHAIDAGEWKIATEGLETIGPAVVSLGFGHVFLRLIEKLPNEKYSQSALLCELVGLAALQVGDLKMALQYFDKAKILYELQKDERELNHLEYLVADVALERGELSSEEFMRVSNKVAQECYQRNEILFGVQVELRLIQVGQTISIKYGDLLPQLLKRSDALFERIESLGSDYDLIKAKALASQAHLIFQVVTFSFQQSAGKVQIREKLGHPIEMDERVDEARAIIDGMQVVYDLYDKAEEIAKEKSEIEWAIIRTSSLVDYAHHLSQIFLIGMVRVAQPSSIAEVNKETKNQLIGILVEFDRCIQVFAKYHISHALVKTLCDAADIYDTLKDVSNRDRLAKEALDLAFKKGFSEIIQRAQRILQNHDTFTSLLDSVDEHSKDEHLVNLDDAGKSALVNTYLRVFTGDTDIELMRTAVEEDIEDMVAAAKQRTTWCRHVQIIQDLRHSKSLNTMYRKIPQKWIVCMEFRYQSPNSGLSFESLWPMFKGIYCLGCTSRS